MEKKTLGASIKYTLLLGSMLIFIEAVLIAGLITNRSKRMKAEKQLLLLNNSLEKLVDERTQELIRKAIEICNPPYNGKTISVTLTIDVATIVDNETIDDLIRRADNAMYQGKRTGRNKVVTV